MDDRRMSALIAVVICAALGFLAFGTHEWWHDEAYLWLIMRSSHSMGEVVANLGFNGHPRFYYLLNWAVLQVAPSPWTLSALNLAFSLVAVGLFAWAAPFTRAQKLLFAAGFYPLWQWGVTLRSYSLLLALVFAWCAVRPAWARALMLALMPQVHLQGMLLAPVLWLVRERRLAAGAAVLASVLFAAWQIAPPSGQGALFGDPVALLTGPGHGFWPNFGVFLDRPLFEVLGFCIFLMSFLVVRDWQYVLSIATLALISLVVYGGYRWHHGFYFIYFLAAVWMAKARTGPLVTAMLALQALVGLYAVAADLPAPYSDGPPVARYLESHGLAGEPLAGIEYRPGQYPATPYKWDMDQLQAVTAHLPGKPMENPRTGQAEPFWAHYREGDAYFPFLDAAAMGAALREERARLGRSYLVVMAWPRKGAPGPAPAPLEKLADFPVPYDYGESMTLYRCP